MYVYILRCEDKSLYTGITTNITKRIKQHLGILAGGAKYTRSHSVVFIEVILKINSDTTARKLEYRIKQMNHIQKEKLLQNSDNIFLQFSELFSDSQIECCDTVEYNKYFKFTDI